MSQENVEHARQGYAMLSDASRAGDLRALRRVIEERFDPAVVLKPAGVGLESQEVHGPEVHGPESALRFLATQMEAFQAMRVSRRDSSMPETGWWCWSGLPVGRGTPALTLSSSAST
jgi:hypothetical protein